MICCSVRSLRNAKCIEFCPIIKRKEKKELWIHYFQQLFVMHSVFCVCREEHQKLLGRRRRFVAGPRSSALWVVSSAWVVTSVIDTQFARREPVGFEAVGFQFHHRRGQRTAASSFRSSPRPTRARRELVLASRDQSTTVGFGPPWVGRPFRHSGTGPTRHTGVMAIIAVAVAASAKELCTQCYHSIIYSI